MNSRVKRYAGLIIKYLGIMKNIFMLFLFLPVFTISAFSQAGTQKENSDETQSSARAEQVEMLMNNKQFVFHARRAEPSGGNSIDLTTNPNYVKFDPDFIESSLPFFGRAYSGVGYDSGDGLHFQGKPDSFTIEKKKNNWEISASVKTNTDNYKLYLSVTPQGFASLSVTSNKLETISYAGEIHAPDEESK
jgi:hypothetical protein